MSSPTGCRPGGAISRATSAGARSWSRSGSRRRGSSPGRSTIELLAWFRNAPVDRDTYWVYFHEPEDNVERGDFTAQEFSDAWSHVARLAASVDNPRLRATMILMCWTVNETSGRDWHDYVPTSGEVDVLAWDCYAKGADAHSYADPAELLEPARVASSEVGADWAIAELGARIQPGTGTDRAAWMEAGRRLRGATHGAVFVTWFDAPIGGAFQLTDEPSIRAWASTGAVRPASGRGPSQRREGGVSQVLVDHGRTPTRMTRPRVLLIVGSGRSGSTLVERALGGVTGVAALGEVVHMWDRSVRDDELCACGRRSAAVRSGLQWAAARSAGGTRSTPTSWYDAATWSCAPDASLSS